MSVASIAALSLPLLGAGVAAGQQIMTGPTAVEAPSVTLRSSTTAADAAATNALDAAAIAVGEAAPELDAGLVGWSEDDLDAYEAYWENGYNYRQLLVLAEEWNLSEFEAKARAGNAILAGDASSFDDLVAGIEPGANEGGDADLDYSGPDAAFWEAGYTYDDAVILGDEWNIKPYEAKVRAAELIAAGSVTVVADILIGS